MRPEGFDSRCETRHPHPCRQRARRDKYPRPKLKKILKIMIQVLRVGLS